MDSTTKETEMSGNSTISDSSTSFELAIGLLDPALYIDNFLYTCHIIFAAIGIPLNLVLIGIIVFWRRLHLSRTFTWLGIGISNTLLLTTHIIDLSLRYWGSNSSTVIALCSWLVPFSLSLQTWYFLSALFERHLCITYPNWHKRNVSANSVVAVQFGCFLSICVIITNIHIFDGLFMPQLFSSWANFNVIGSIALGLLPVCLTGQVLVMRAKTKQHYPSIEVINLQIMGNNQQEDGEMAEENDRYYTSYFVRVGNSRLSRLEMEGVSNIYLICKVYLLFMIPILVSFILVFVCFYKASSSAAPALSDPTGADGVTSCSSYIQGFYYTAGILSCLHSSIVNPLLVVFLSSDVMSVLMARKG